MGLFYEADKTFSELMKEKKNFVFIGEAGSGKSEIVLNVANKLAESTGRKVDLFDLDQTKPLYRSRDMKEDFAGRGVTIHYQDQYLDAPVMVGGVRVSLVSDNYTLLDIGGGHQVERQQHAGRHQGDHPAFGFFLGHDRQDLLIDFHFIGDDPGGMCDDFFQVPSGAPAGEIDLNEAADVFAMGAGGEVR